MDIGPRISVHLAMAIGDISGHPHKKKRHEMHYSRFFPPFITISSSFRSLMPYSLYLGFIFSVHCCLYIYIFFCSYLSLDFFFFYSEASILFYSSVFFGECAISFLGFQVQTATWAIFSCKAKTGL